VEVEIRGDQVELIFARPFTLGDVEAVKSVPGREWHARRQKWLLPHTPETLPTLQRLFGSRLRISTNPGKLVTTARSSAPASLPVMSRAASGDGRRHGRTSANEAPAAFAETLDALRRASRTREYSGKTERAYEAWVRRLLEFHAGRVSDPADLTAEHARAFLEDLAMEQRLAARTRNQAASALGFLFREVLGRDDMAAVPRAKDAGRMPMVLTHREVMRVLEELHGKFFLVVVLLYSAGLRLQECLCLRIKDIDFELRQILIRDGKGRKDRYVPLAHRAAELLRVQIGRVAALHEKDGRAGHGWAPLPAALHRKDPTAGDALGWQFIFPASTNNRDPTTGRSGRWPLHATAVQRQVKAALRRSGITKRASCHTFRHSFATEALRGGCDIRTLQHVMGHKDIRTTMIYLHVVEQTGYCIHSPLDRPDDPADDTADAGFERVGGLQWELAARQWSRPPHPLPKPTGPDPRGRSGRKRT